MNFTFGRLCSIIIYLSWWSGLSRVFLLEFSGFTICFRVVPGYDPDRYAGCAVCGVPSPDPGRAQWGVRSAGSGDWRSGFFCFCTLYPVLPPGGRSMNSPRKPPRQRVREQYNGCETPFRVQGSGSRRVPAHLSGVPCICRGIAWIRMFRRRDGFYAGYAALSSDARRSHHAAPNDAASYGLCCRGGVVSGSGPVWYPAFRVEIWKGGITFYISGNAGYLGNIIYLRDLTLRFRYYFCAFFKIILLCANIMIYFII